MKGDGDKDLILAEEAAIEVPHDRAIKRKVFGRVRPRAVPPARPAAPQSPGPASACLDAALLASFRARTLPATSAARTVRLRQTRAARRARRRPMSRDGSEVLRAILRVLRHRRRKRTR